MRPRRESSLKAMTRMIAKAYRVAGYRAGWLAITGPKDHASSFIEGIHLLANMRLCPNVPAQHAIQVALGGHQSIDDLVLPGGRLLEQRDVAWSKLNEIPGVSCVKPAGALYAFPRWLTALGEALPPGQPLPNLADLIQERCDKLLEQVCMPVQQ